MTTTSAIHFLNNADLKNPHERRTVSNEQFLVRNIDSTLGERLTINVTGFIHFIFHFKQISGS